MKLFYVCDEGDTRFYLTLSEAKEDAEYQIDICRENCDPEWPMSTESIAVYECENETEYPEEDGVCVLTATAIPIEPPYADAGEDIDWCDYRMEPPRARAALGGQSHE